MNATALNTKMQHALTFGAHEVKTITREGQRWISNRQLTDLLGYADEKSVHRLYTSHGDEFTHTMARVFRVVTAGGKQAMRFFSLRGAHLIAMFARTPVAKAFRIWVLNILDSEVAALKATAHAGKDISHNTRLALSGICNEVHFMASWWRHFGKGIELINPHAYYMIYERFLFAPSRADDLIKEFGLRSWKEEARTQDWEWAVRESRKKAKMADRYTECAQ